MLMLCMSWGFNQISVKLALHDIPPLTQAVLRSIGGLAVIVLIAGLRGVPLFRRDGTLKAGLVAGLLFGTEFVLIYRGLIYTTASRAVVFLYVAPFVVALGSKRFLGERLNGSQWSGLALSFAGVALAIGVPQPSVDRMVIFGDLLVLAGGILWAATTLVIKSTRLLTVPPEKALAYQVVVSIPILALAALWFGERMDRWPDLIATGSLIYQTVWVVGITFLIWFGLIRTYSVSKLSSFTFMTPLFGVIGGYFIMHDSLTMTFAGAALLVMAGLYLVNRPQEAIADPLLPVTKT